MRFMTCAVAFYTNNPPTAVIFGLTWTSVVDTTAILNMSRQLSFSFIPITVTCGRFFCQTSGPSHGLQDCGCCNAVGLCD